MAPILAIWIWWQAIRDASGRNCSGQIAGTSFKEIDRLIDELHALRDHLQDEGLRVQREIVKYAQLSQAAMKSTKIIAEGMTQMQNGASAAPHKGW